MRAFVYGFKPFLSYDQNVTEPVIQAIRPRRGLTRRVFDVKFDRALFVTAVKRARPELVIGLGMHGRARKVRIERRAVNVQRASPSAQARPIRQKGPHHLYASFKIPPSDLSTVTYDAGTYVCNFSMYVLMEYCASATIPYAFLHIPPRIRVRSVADFVERLLR